MFSLRILKSMTRALNINKDLKRFAKRSNNPGIDKRLNVFGPADKGIEDEIEDLDNIETDFMNVHKSHIEHEIELDKQRQAIKHYIVREKYFKENYPNFLTWHDKEQIRYLHRKDPEEWTIENLSNSFPALRNTIKKLVKSNWTKPTQNKITNHDNSVQKNWEMFKNHELSNLPEELVEHLKKFTNRALNFKPFELNETINKKIQVKTIKTKRTEFSDIISSYEKLKNKSITDSNFEIKDKKPIRIPVGDSDTYLIEQVNSKYSIPLSEYKNKLDKKAVSAKLSEEEKIIRADLQNKTDSKENKVETSKIDENEVFVLAQNKYENTSEISNVKKCEQRNLSHLVIPERINIPKKLYKKGYVYKLNDCYYDDDGEFLYRVPGMS